MDEYYGKKPNIKKEHPDWTSEQVSRFGICFVGLKMGIDNLVEKDERAEKLKDTTYLCDIYATNTK